MPVEEITSAQYDQFTAKNRAAVVDVWAPWCGPCRTVAPIVDRLSQKYAGKVAFGKMNSDDNQDKTIALGIQGIPTLLLYKQGKLVDRIVGAQPEADLDEHIRRIL